MTNTEQELREALRLACETLENIEPHDWTPDFFLRKARQSLALAPVQPETPATCNTCGSDDPAVSWHRHGVWPWHRPSTFAHFEPLAAEPCPDPFHTPTEED